MRAGLAPGRAGALSLDWQQDTAGHRELTFERQSRVGYLIVFKVLQILLDIALIIPGFFAPAAEVVPRAVRDPTPAMRRRAMRWRV